LKESWVVYQASKDASEMYQELYSSNTILQNEFLEYWRIVSKYFKNEDIYGYEIFNEPWVGDYFKHPSLAIPKNANNNLNQMYQNVINIIRENDSDCKKKIQLEPITFTVMGKMGLNLNDVCDNLGLGYHGYFPPNYNIDEMFKYHTTQNLSSFLNEFDLGLDNTKVDKALSLLTNRVRRSRPFIG
jgi:hypothetical protein